MTSIANSPDTLLRLLAEQTTEYALMLLDQDGRCVWWGPGAEEVFSLSSDAVLGQPVHILFSPLDVERGIPEHELLTARVHGVAQDDRWMMRGDGSLFWASGVMIALRDPDGDVVGFGKILRNRTDVREHIETLQNRLAASETESQRKDLFLSTLSHELRNPLAPLANAVELIRATAPPNAELEYPLQIIDRQIVNLRRLVDDLLDLTRIGAGKIDLKKEPTDIQRVLQRAIDSASILIRERRHRVELLLPPVPIVVEADPDRLEQVFVNLINNAAKYTPPDGQIWIKGNIEADEAVVRVEDNGIGISTDMLPAIFDLFTQVESSRAQAMGGLGIGLSVVKNLVTLHGGSVQVRSDGEGKGSEFTVRLPL